MKLITLNVPEPYLDILNKLVKEGYYPNRAVAIRVAIRDLIQFHNMFVIKGAKFRDKFPIEGEKLESRKS